MPSAKSNNPGVAIQIYMKTLKEKIDSLESEVAAKDSEIENLKKENLKDNNVFETL